MSYERIAGTFTLLSPLVHSEGVVSNVAKFRTLPLRVENNIEEVPALSGNSIRGLLRRNSAAYLCERLGIQSQELSARLYYCLFSGGSLQKGVSQSGRDTKFFATLRSVVPHLSLFGAAVAQEIMPGKLIVDWAYPVCRETNVITGITSEIPACDLLDAIRYTRLDDLEDKAEDTATQQMIYEVESLISGTVLCHSFTLNHATPLERGAFHAALHRLLSRPYLGGMSGKGHGKMTSTYVIDVPAMDMYREFLEDNLEAIKQYLLETLGVAA